MKVRRLRRIVKHILEEPLRVNMTPLIHSRDPNIKSQLSDERRHLPFDHVHRWPDCGTVACIAGWEIVLYGKVDFTENGDNIWTSQERLELPNSKLFYVPSWPTNFQTKLHDERPGTLAYAQIVAQAVEDYIKTGGWPNRENENQDTLSLTNDQGTYSVYRY